MENKKQNWFWSLSTTELVDDEQEGLDALTQRIRELMVEGWHCTVVPFAGGDFDEMQAYEKSPVWACQKNGHRTRYINLQREP